MSVHCDYADDDLGLFGCYLFLIGMYVVACVLYLFFFFFFQAEDGIRDVAVTGVQTCALPISHDPGAVSIAWRGRKLGYVPRRENAALAWGLDRGEPLRARISRLAPHPNPARRVEFEVYFE